MAAPAEMLFGLHTDNNLIVKSQDLSVLSVGNTLQRVPSVPGSLKLVIIRMANNEHNLR